MHILEQNQHTDKNQNKKIQADLKLRLIVKLDLARAILDDYVTILANGTSLLRISF